MANLENNNDKENKSVSEQIGDSVHKGVENVQETVKQGAELAKDAVEHPVETAGAFAEQAAKDVTNVKWWAKLLQILFWVGLFLVVSIFIIINLPVTKNWAAQRVITMLNKDLKSNFSFSHVDVDYFGNITIDDVVVKDYKNFPFIKAKQLYADSNWFSIISNSRNLQFQSLSIDKMDMKVITYKNDSIANFIRFVDLFGKGPSNPNRPPFELKSRIYITNSKISIVNENHEGDAGKWLDAKNVSLIVPELKVKGPDVFAQINNLRFTTERWGKKHYVETFSGDLNYTKQFLSLRDITINTDHSLLQGDIKFNIHDGSWSDFNNKVRMEMKLNSGSQISGYDLSYFVTNWDNYKPVNISGNLSGPLNNLYLDNFLLGNPNVKIHTGTMQVKEIMNPRNFLIETRNLSTDFTYKDLKAMLPTFIATKMKNFADNFGKLTYNGAVRVTPEQVYIPNGSLITGIGSAKISRFTLSDYSTQLPKYKGYAEVRDLNTTVITKSKQVGLITGKFNIDGQSFDVNTMRLRTKSEIAKIEITGKEINNLYLDGILDHKKYFGIINVNDEQAKTNVKGLIDFSTKKLMADVTADINHLNINYFTNSKGSQIVSGYLKGKLAMSNVNDLTADADISTLTFSDGTRKYVIPSSKVSTYFENGNRVISVDAPSAVTGKIAGKYNLSDLTGMVQNGINKILVGPPPRKLYRGQNFNADFDIKQGLVSYFEPDLKIPNGAKVSGSYDGNSNNLVLNADAVSIKYIMTKTEEITDADRALAKANPAYKITDPRATKDSAMVDNLTIRINTANVNEQIFAKVDRLQYGKNIFKEFSLSGRNEDNKVLHLATNFKMGSPEEEIDGKLKEYAININQTTNSAGDYVLRFEPTQIKYNDVAWNIDTNPELNHSITYRKKSGDFLIQNLRVFSDNSELFVKNGVFKSAKEFEADAEVKNLDISKIMMMQTGGNSMDIQGFANGTLKIKMSKNNLEPIIDLNIDKIKMNGKEMGDILVDIKNSTMPNVFDVNAKVLSAGIIGKNSLDVSGTINNNTKTPTLDLSANMKDFDLAFSNEFVKSVFSNMRGKANGILKISGPTNDIDYSGDIALHGFGLKLNFTGVDYSMDDTVISLSKGLAILNNIGIKDGRANSAGTISGLIRFETLSSMGVDLVMNAKNLLVLNTTQKDFDLFWGRVYGQGDLYVSGPVSALNIATSQRDPFRALNNSNFTFNSNSTSNVEEFKMLRFLKEDKSGQISVEEKKKSGANVNVDFNIAVDKGTTVNVLVGDNVGNISVRGEADNLSFKMSRNGNIAMNGAYFVDNGTFISKAILNRTFQITKGSSIQWDGDAMSPALDITANYMKSVSNAGEYLNLGTKLPPINVLLQTKIMQTLNNPRIDLGVSAPDVSSQIKETLAAKMNQEDERVIQFGSILVLNSFNVSNAGLFDINLGTTIQSSGYNILFKQLGSVLNSISNQFQIDLNYIKSDPGSNTSDRANAGVSFILSPRVTIKTGLGIPLSKTDNTNANYLSGEGIIEYDFSKKNDGTRLLRFYSKPTNIGMASGTNAGNASANQSYGAGVVYSKSFNNLFKKQKKNDSSEANLTKNKKDSMQNTVSK